MKAGDKRICPICGKEFEIIDKGWTRKYCYECSPKINDSGKRTEHAHNITVKRRALKEMLIAYKGGKCERCGYNLNPSIKDFGISKQINRNIDDLKAEVDKCILLCSNCHAELHQELYEQGLISEDE